MGNALASVALRRVGRASRKLEALLLRGLAIRIHRSPYRRQKSPAKESSVIRVFVYVLSELILEFAKLIS